MSTRCFTYTAFGLRIASEKPIFEFEPEQDIGSPDIVFRWPAGGCESPDYMGKDWRFELDCNRALLCFKGVGTFHVADTATIIIQPEHDAAPRLVERYLSGVVMAVALYLRGLVVYHAACVALNNREAIAFIGDSGAGKSTLAALLHLRGLTCLTDDVTAVRVEGQEIMAMPSFPKMKIPGRLVLEHRIPADLLCPIHGEQDEVYLSLGRHFPARPMALRALFFLGVESGTSVRKLTARETMLATILHTLPSRLLRQMGSGDHFNKCAAIAGRVPAYLLTRGGLKGESGDQWVEMVMNTLVENKDERC